MRLFVSVDLPERFVEPIAQVQSRVTEASGLNFVAPENTHITLKFLGDVAESRLETLESKLAAGVAGSDVDPFTARLGGLGVFPDLEYIRVLWLGVETDDHQMQRLHETIEDRTTALGFDPANHEFTPHVTIARMEHAGGKKLVQNLVQNEDPSIGSFDVDSIHLTESTLTASGPEYSTVATFPLE